MQSNAIDRVTIANFRKIGLHCSSTDIFFPLPVLTAFTEFSDPLQSTTNLQPCPTKLGSFVEERLGGWVSVVQRSNPSLHLQRPSPDTSMIRAISVSYAGGHPVKKRNYAGIELGMLVPLLACRWLHYTTYTT